MSTLFTPGSVIQKVPYLEAFRIIKLNNREFPSIPEIDSYVKLNSDTRRISFPANVLLISPPPDLPFKKGVDIKSSDGVVLPFSHLNQFNLPLLIFERPEVHLLLRPCDIVREGHVRKKDVVYPLSIEVLDYSSYLNVQFNRLFGICGILNPANGLPLPSDANNPHSPQRSLSFSGTLRSDIFCLVRSFCPGEPDRNVVYAKNLKPSYFGDFVSVVSINNASTPFRD